MSHRCHADACGREIPPRLLMCGKHWGLVPRSLQRAVWRYYRPGQEQDKAPSAIYMLVQNVAVLEVAREERRVTGDQAVARLQRAWDLWIDKVTDGERGAYVALLEELLAS